MFDDAGAFNVPAFEEGLNALVERQGRALVILNFPCHNPTGYSLDAAEWEAVAAATQRAASKGPIALLLDLAYSHFGADGANPAWAKALASISKDVTILAAWTASKSFAQYGARVGALIASVPDATDRMDIANAFSYTCRGSWSNCNHLGLLAITQLLCDPALAVKVKAERAGLVAVLSERVIAFNREASAAGLRYPRYEGGFFVSVFTPDAAATAAMAASNGVFVVPMDGAVRLALCSVSAADIPHLVAEVARGVRAAEGVQAPGGTR